MINKKEPPRLHSHTGRKGGKGGTKTKSQPHQLFGLQTLFHRLFYYRLLLLTMSSSHSRNSRNPPLVPMAYQEGTGTNPVVPDQMPGQNLDNYTEAVRQMEEQNRPENTRLAYNPKMDEWAEFCDYRFPTYSPQIRYLVTKEKSYEFLFYQAMRSKKPTGGSCSRGNNRFSKDDYEATMARYRTVGVGNTLAQLPTPENPVGFDTFNTYKAAILNIWRRQVSTYTNNLPWCHVWCEEHQLLAKHVLKRRPRIQRQNYMEKVDHEFAPYTALDDVPRIENELWCKGHGGSFRSAYCWIRNRFCFLFTFNGILRCESLYKAELSDMLCVQTKKNRDPHKLLLLVMQLATGKFI